MTKVRMNRGSGQFAKLATVYLDGRKLVMALEANEAEGYVWAEASGNISNCGLSHIAISDARPGDYLILTGNGGIPVKKLIGNVEIRLDAIETPEEEMRRDIAASFHPLCIVQVVQ